MKTDKEIAIDKLKKSKLSKKVNFLIFKYYSEKIDISHKLEIEKQFSLIFDFISETINSKFPNRTSGYEFKVINASRKYSYEVKFNSGSFQEYRLLIKMKLNLIIDMKLINKKNFKKTVS